MGIRNVLVCPRIPHLSQHLDKGSRLLKFEYSTFVETMLAEGEVSDRRSFLRFFKHLLYEVASSTFEHKFCYVTSHFKSWL
jgi:hypothetical protein